MRALVYAASRYLDEFFLLLRLGSSVHEQLQSVVRCVR
jgi:hypothetical protein